jgi:hypothetical protein
VSDEFLQKQINELQTGQEELRGLVAGALDKAERNNDALLHIRDDMEHVKRNMMTVEQLSIALEIERNSQIVRGLKWAAAIIAATIATKWAEAMHWFQDIGQ